MENVNNDEIEIDLVALMHLLLKHIKAIIVCVLLGMVVSTGVTVFLMDKKYESVSRIYLKPEINATGQVDYSSVNSNNLMVNNYIAVMKSETIRESVAEELGINPGIIYSGLSVSNEPDTQVIVIKCQTIDPVLSKDIVELTEKNFFNKMKTSLSITNMEILDAPKVNTSPVSPNVMKNMILGGLVGGVISVGYLFVLFILDKKIKTSEEAEKCLGLPVLGVIPYRDL